jgi:hypothetical protein
LLARALLSNIKLPSKNTIEKMHSLLLSLITSHLIFLYLYNYIHEAPHLLMHELCIEMDKRSVTIAIYQRPSSLDLIIDEHPCNHLDKRL